MSHPYVFHTHLPLHLFTLKTRKSFDTSNQMLSYFLTQQESQFKFYNYKDSQKMSVMMLIYEAAKGSDKGLLPSLMTCVWFLGPIEWKQRTNSCKLSWLPPVFCDTLPYTHMHARAHTQTLSKMLFCVHHSTHNSVFNQLTKPNRSKCKYTQPMPF